VGEVSLIDSETRKNNIETVPGKEIIDVSAGSESQVAFETVIMRFPFNGLR